MNTERKEKEREKVLMILIIIIRNQMERIYSVWDGYNLDMNIQTERAKIVWNHIQNLLKAIYVEEDAFYKLYKERITNYKEKIAQLCKDLQITPSESVFEGSWIDIEEMLSQELHTLTEKSMKIKAYQELKNKELELCQKLNLQERRPLSNTEVPSEKDFLELEKQMEILYEEKERRQMKFDAARKELMTKLEVIEFSPESPLEEEIIRNDKLTLTDDAFKALEEVTNKVQRNKEEIEVKKNVLIGSLTVLWQSLEVQENEKREFLSKHADCRQSTIHSIEQELKKCEAIKCGNLRPYILDQQTQLAQLWDKCYVSQPQRDKFPHLYSTQLSLEVLEALKSEVDKWKRHFSKVEHILEKIDKMKHLWDTLHVLEEAANDPNRFLFSKRNLLHDMKERKKLLEKDLPSLEKDIFEDIDRLKSKDGLNFLYNGEEFKTYVTNQWAERNYKKENKKVEKLKLSSRLDNKPVVKNPLKRTSSVNFAKSSQPKLQRSKTLYNDKFKTQISNQKAKSSSQKTNDSAVHKKHFVQKNKDVNFATPLRTTVTNFAKTAPSKFFKSSMSPFNTPTVNRSKVMPTTVAKMASKPSIRPIHLLKKK